jgi:hypothetical protein
MLTVKTPMRKAGWGRRKAVLAREMAMARRQNAEK